MKTTARTRVKKMAIDFNSATFTLSRAKTYLGRLVEKAGNGETVYIMRGHRRFILQEVPPIDPIPIRPPGYFSAEYSPAEIKEQNLLGKSSVRRAPKDIE